MNADDHETQREALAAAILKRMTSSYIGASPPALRGDAERAVWAVIHEGWQPPVTDALVDHVTAALKQRFHTRRSSAGSMSALRDDVKWILETAANGVPPEGEE